MAGDIKIAKKIRELREKNNMTQEELAEKVGYTSSYKKSSIHKIEKGEQDIPRNKIPLFAKALNTSVSELMNWDNNETPQLISGYNGSKTQIISNKVSILGKVACGEPIFSPESADAYTTVDSNIHVDFALVATGDSMIEDHIYDGDIVLIRQQPTVELGEIAAVSINDEVTLKRVYYYPKDNRMVLNPSNPQHKPMMFFNEELENIRILGKVIAVQHFFEK